MPTLLIVDDSPTARLALRRALAIEPAIEIVAEFGDGEATLAFLAERSVDLIVMDVFLDREDGIDLARRIMRRHPTPILIVTGLDATDAALAFRAVEAGALELVAKPPAASAADYQRCCRHLVRLVKSLAKVPVVTHKPARPARVAPVETSPLSRAPSAILIGASTGGPPVVMAILASLPRPFPVPIVIVQHIADGFAAGMASWLSTSTGHLVRVCDEAQLLGAGQVLLAPAGRHLHVAPGAYVVPVAGPERDYQRPSVDELFDSGAAVLGASAVGVLLTGMGRDGVAGLDALRRAGALTIAQSPETCAVSGMATLAVTRGVAARVLRPAEIASALSRLVTHHHAEEHHV